MNVTSRDVMIAIAAAGVTLAAVVMAQQPMQPKPMESTVFAWDKLEVQTTRNGARRAVFDRATTTLDRLECHITTVNAGEASHAPHRHPDEEMIFVKEGTLEVTINGVAQRGGAGSVFFYASNDLHGMRNIGDTPATYFVLRWTSPGHEGPKPPQ